MGDRLENQTAFDNIMTVISFRTNSRDPGISISQPFFGKTTFILDSHWTGVTFKQRNLIHHYVFFSLIKYDDTYQNVKCQQDSISFLHTTLNPLIHLISNHARSFLMEKIEHSKGHSLCHKKNSVQM